MEIRGKINRFDNVIEILLLLLVYLCLIYKFDNKDINLFYRNILKDNEVNYIRLELNDACITERKRIDNITFFFHFHSTVQLTSSPQGCSYTRRNVTDNNYETPHHYTEIQV